DVGAAPLVSKWIADWGAICRPVWRRSDVAASGGAARDGAPMGRSPTDRLTSEGRRGTASPASSAVSGVISPPLIYRGRRGSLSHRYQASPPALLLESRRTRSGPPHREPVGLTS